MGEEMVEKGTPGSKERIPIKVHEKAPPYIGKISKIHLSLVRTIHVA